MGCITTNSPSDAAHIVILPIHRWKTSLPVCHIGSQYKRQHSQSKNNTRKLYVFAKSVSIVS